jgi:hypothetical protein
MKLRRADDVRSIVTLGAGLTFIEMPPLEPVKVTEKVTGRVVITKVKAPAATTTRAAA